MIDATKTQIKRDFTLDSDTPSMSRVPVCVPASRAAICTLTWTSHRKYRMYRIFCRTICVCVRMRVCVEFLGIGGTSGTYLSLFFFNP